MVGQVKRWLRKVSGDAKLSLDELNTVLTETENTLNLRSLTYQYEELGVEVLMPFQLLFGRRFSPLSKCIDPIVKDYDENKSSLSWRFLDLTRKLSRFWSRWRKEYLVGFREVYQFGTKEAWMNAIGNTTDIASNITSNDRAQFYTSCACHTKFAYPFLQLVTNNVRIDSAVFQYFFFPTSIKHNQYPKHKRKYWKDSRLRRGILSNCVMDQCFSFVSMSLLSLTI